MGGALKRSSGLNMYMFCVYGPGGELDRSKQTHSSAQTSTTQLYVVHHNNMIPHSLYVTFWQMDLTWRIRALQRVHMQRVKHLKVGLLHMNQIINGAHLTGNHRLKRKHKLFSLVNIYSHVEQKMKYPDEKTLEHSA